MDFIKKHLSPIVMIAILLVGGFVLVKGKWFLGDLWSDRQHSKYEKQAEADRKIVDEKNKAIDALTQQIRDLNQQAKLKEQETLTYKELAETKSKQSAAIAEKTQEAFNEYEKNIARIGQYGSDYDLCINVTCPIRADSGYPCPAKFCDQFTREAGLPATPPQP